MEGPVQVGEFGKALHSLSSLAPMEAPLRFAYIQRMLALVASPLVHARLRPACKLGNASQISILQTLPRLGHQSRGGPY